MLDQVYATDRVPARGTSSPLKVSITTAVRVPRHLAHLQRADQEVWSHRDDGVVTTAESLRGHIMIVRRALTRLGVLVLTWISYTLRPSPIPAWTFAGARD
jgi:hypothetical protein